MPYTPKDYEKIAEYKQEMIQKSHDLFEKMYHKDQYSDPYARAVVWCDSVMSLLKKGHEVEETNSGLLLVDGRYYVAHKKWKWRVKGRNKWYHGNPPTDKLSHPPLTNPEASPIYTTPPDERGEGGRASKSD